MWGGGRLASAKQRCISQLNVSAVVGSRAGVRWLVRLLLVFVLGMSPLMFSSCSL